MKKFLGIFLILLVIGVAFLAKFHDPYLYLPIPKYWSVSKLGFPEIKEPEDFTLYYLDVIDAKGYNKKEIRYSAIHQAYRNSEEGSYVNIFSLINLSGSSDNIDNKIHMQKKVLDQYMAFENHCYNKQCGSGHSIAGVAYEYSRNLAKEGDLDGAFNILRETYLSRKSDLQPWVKFSLLEEVYFILEKKDINQKELDFFASEVAKIKAIDSNDRLADRYRNLLVWNKKLQSRYSEQTSFKN